MRTLAVALLFCAALSAADARADDWSVRRSEFDPRVVARYKSLLERSPNNSYALKRLVGLYRRHSSLKRLIAEYRARAAAAPRSHALQLILGHLNRRAGKLDQAVESYRKAADLRPKDPAAHAAQGAALARLGQRQQAAEAYGKALALARSSADKKRYLRALTKNALASRDPAAAAGHLRRLVQLEPGKTRLRLELARALSSANQHAGALEQLRAALARTSDSAQRAEILKQIGQAHGHLGHDQEALAAFRKAMALTPRGHWLRRAIVEQMIALYSKRQNLKSLIADLERRWKRRGQFEHQVLGRLYSQTGDDARALKSLRAALKLAPYSVETRLRIITLLDRASRSDEALDEYRKLVRIAPGEPRYQIELAKRLYQAGQQKQALEVLERCGRRFPGDASVHSILADLFTRWGDPARATRASRALVRIEPRDPAHLINLGEQYFQSGDKRRALETWKRLLRVIPRRYEALAALAEVYGNHNMLQQAITTYRKAIRLRPRAVAYQRALAMLLENARKHDPALQAWERVMVLAQASKNRGKLKEARSHTINILRQQRRLRARVRILQNKFNAPSPDLEAGYFLAEALVVLGSREQAASVYRRILELRQDDLESLLALERIYRRQRQLRLAVEVLKRLARVQPSRAREHYQRIADLLLELYDDKQALVYAHKAVALGSGDARSHQRLGRLYEKKEDYAAAMKAYERAMALDPGYFSAYFAAARLHSLQGRPQQADRLYRQVLQRGSSPEIIRKAYRLTVGIATYLGTLESLEKLLAPLTVTSPQAEVYRQLMLETYRRRVPLLVDRARWGSARGRREARQQLRRIGQRGLSPLLDELSRFSSAEREVVPLLGYLGNPSAVPILLRIASRQDENVVTFYGSRRGAWRFANRFRYGRGYTVWSSDRDRVARSVRVAVALGRIGHPRAAPGLVRMLRSRQGPVRDAAAWALSRLTPQLQDPQAARALFEALGDARWTVQVSACAGLGASGDSAMRPVLEEVASDLRRREEVRAACAWGLGALGDPRAVPTLVQILRAGDGETQRCAAWSLGALAVPATVEPLLMELWNKRPRVRAAILWALGRIGRGAGPLEVRSTPDVVHDRQHLLLETFVERLTEAVDDDPAAAAGDLRDLTRGPEVLASMVLRKPDAVAGGLRRALNRHRDVALRALRDLAPGPDGPCLRPLTDGEPLLRPEIRVRLRRAVAGVGRRIRPALVALLQHRDEQVRAGALRVAAGLPAGGTAPLLKRALADPSRQVRLAALEALRRAALTEPQRAALAAGALKPGAHWRVRLAATRALFGSGHHLARGALLRAARDPNGFVRQAAARSLGGLRTAEARQALRRLLKDEAPGVRQAARRALK
jgi:tetratricopeptide (TPR) repeat protein/HEAT repeat protein